MPSQSMAHARTKLKPQEAALLAGEVQKPSWESKNEGIHERVSFADSIWGFDLAGGSFYKTPLRVTAVKPDSRAEKAGIRPGDRLKRINDIDTSTLTIQEAHAIIIESGVHLRLAVTAPEDVEDSYHCWQDTIEEEYDEEAARRREKELEEKRRVHAKVSSYWSLQWPWVSKRRVIYRESNCFMVPSKYESKHKGKFSELPLQKTTDDVVLFSNKNEDQQKYRPDKTPPQSPLPNGTDSKQNFPLVNGIAKNENIPKIDEEAEDSLSKTNEGIIQEILGKDNTINNNDDEVLEKILSDTNDMASRSIAQEIKENGVDVESELSTSEQILDEVSHSEEILDEISHTEEISEQIDTVTNSEEILDELSHSEEILNEVSHSEEIINEESKSEEFLDELSHSGDIVNGSSSEPILDETSQSEEILDELSHSEEILNEVSHSEEIINEESKSEEFLDELSHSGDIVNGSSSEPILDETSQSEENLETSKSEYDLNGEQNKLLSEVSDTNESINEKT